MAPTTKESELPRCPPLEANRRPHIAFYDYDGADQLSSIDVPGGAAGDQTYTYDASGHLASVTSGGSQTSDYLYDPLNESASSGPVLETDGAGTSGPSAFNLRTPGGDLLTRAGQTSGTLSSLALVSPTAIHPDEMGSPLAETSSIDGAASDLTAFSAFGEPVYSSASPALPYGYLDRVGLSGGLVNMNARPYDPNIGRFLQQDPVVGDPQVGQDWNPYAYGMGNPISTPDESGLCPVEEFDSTTGPGCGAPESSAGLSGYLGGSATADCQTSSDLSGCDVLVQQASVSFNLGFTSTAFGAAGDLATGLDRWTTGISGVLRSGDSAAARSAAARLLPGAGRLLETAPIKFVGKAALPVAVTLDGVENISQDGLLKGGARTVLEGSGSLGGAALGDAVCAAATASTAGAGVVICPVAIGGLAWVGGKVGDAAANILGL